MGKLIRNGIEYGGGNGTDIFEVTQAEYDALVQAGTLVHNALYVITDAPNLNATAQDISYDGSTDTVWDKVESKINKTSASGSMTCEVGTLSRGSLRKLGDIKFFAFVITTNSTVTTSTNIITLPTGFEASGSIDCPAMARSGGVDNSCTIWVQNNKIQYNSMSAVASGGYIFANGWYI